MELTYSIIGTLNTTKNHTKRRGRRDGAGGAGWACIGITPKVCLPEGGLGMLGMECTPIPVKTHQLAQSRAHFNTTKHTPKLAQSIAQRVPRWAGWGLGWVGHTLGWNDVILINLTPGAVGLRGLGRVTQNHTCPGGRGGAGGQHSFWAQPQQGSADTTGAIIVVVCKYSL